MIQVAPSLLAADFARPGEEVSMVNKSRASLIHIDVMDGMFVPNITIGFPVIKAISRIAEKPHGCPYDGLRSGPLCRSGP